MRVHYEDTLTQSVHGVCVPSYLHDGARTAVVALRVARDQGYIILSIILSIILLNHTD